MAVKPKERWDFFLASELSGSISESWLPHGHTSEYKELGKVIGSKHNSYYTEYLILLPDNFCLFSNLKF